MAPKAEETIPDQQEEEKNHEEPGEENQERGEKTDPPWQTRSNADKRGEIHQKSHLEKYASDGPPDPNSDSPYARHCIRERHTQQTVKIVWCVREEQEEQSKRNQTIEA